MRICSSHWKAQRSLSPARQKSEIVLEAQMQGKKVKGESPVTAKRSQGKWLFFFPFREGWVLVDNCEVLCPALPKP